MHAEASGECIGNNVVLLLEPSAMGGVKRPVGLLCPIKYSNWQCPLEGAYGEAMVGEFGGAAWARGFQRVPLEPVVCDCCWGASCDCVNRGFTGAGFSRRAGQVDEVVTVIPQGKVSEMQGPVAGEAVKLETEDEAEKMYLGQQLAATAGELDFATVAIGEVLKKSL